MTNECSLSFPAKAGNPVVTGIAARRSLCDYWITPLSRVMTPKARRVYRCGEDAAMSRLEYPIVVEPLPAEEGGGFLATAPDLPGCMSDGETPEEAVSNIQDAIAAWIEAARDLGHVVPKPSRRLPLAS
jgi:predicted RNase H-like HicB family nuclease